MAGLQRGQTIGVKGEQVVDGDTVRVRRAGWWAWLMPGEAIVVRLYGIDAPESRQRYGEDATAALRKFLKGRGQLMLEARDADRYGRTVGLLYRKGPGREDSANLRMVREGWTTPTRNTEAASQGSARPNETRSNARPAHGATGAIAMGKTGPGISG